jgi:hypothetical protein
MEAAPLLNAAFHFSSHYKLPYSSLLYLFSEGYFNR